MLEVSVAYSEAVKDAVGDALKRDLLLLCDIESSLIVLSDALGRGAAFSPEGANFAVISIDRAEALWLHVQESTGRVYVMDLPELHIGFTAVVNATNQVWTITSMMLGSEADVE